MKCPFCAEEVKDDAVVCKHCRHDLTVVRACSIAGAIERRVPLVSPMTTLLLALGVLLIAHFLIIVHFDLPLIWLHVASLIIPFVFGFIYRQNATEYLSHDLVAGAVLALLAILAMSAVVAEVDKVTVLPTDSQGWFEFLEYGASIALAFSAAQCAGRPRLR